MLNDSLFILEPNITAKDMAGAIGSIASILKDKDIITDNGYSSLLDIQSQLKAFKNNKYWFMSVDIDRPIEFEIIDKVLKEKDPVSVILSSEKISIDLNNEFPFINLDVCVVIRNMDEEPISRWHFDLANQNEEGVMQPGPLTHLQYGGHNSGNREYDHPLKIPRWCHPPMDIILLCEAIVANFFPEKWDLIKDNPSWCHAIAESQKICYSAYLYKMIKSLGLSSTTILQEMDAKSWNQKMKA